MAFAATTRPPVAASPVSSPPLTRPLRAGSPEQPAARPANPLRHDFSRTRIHADTHAVAVDANRAQQGTGRPVAPKLAEPLEDWLGIDPSPVRIHNDAFASAAAAAMNANAFTVGRDIFFGAGQYDPLRPDGLLRLGHELVHSEQTRGRGPAAAGQHGELERQADAWLAGERSPLRVVGPTILREPTFPRRATGTQMLAEAARVIALVRDPAATDETTRKWSNVASNFGAVTAGSIARRIWTNLFLRHFTEAPSRPGVESVHPRYFYSHTYGWIDGQHFFGFIDYAERHLARLGDRQQAFEAATAQGVEIERQQQQVRDYVVAGASPDPGPLRHLQVRPPNTPLFRAPQAVYGGLAGMAANVYAGVALTGTESELFGQLDRDQRVKFWTDAAKSAWTYEDIISDQLGTRFFFTHGAAINAAPAATREGAFVTALRAYFSSIGVENDQSVVDRKAVEWGLPGVERFLAPTMGEAEARRRHPELFSP